MTDRLLYGAGLVIGLIVEGIAVTRPDYPLAIVTLVLLVLNVVWLVDACRHHTPDP